MTLAANLPALRSDLEALFSAGTLSESDARQAWGDALSAYFSGLSPSVSGILPAAISTFKASLAGMSEPKAAPVILSASLATLGATLAAGPTLPPSIAPPPFVPPLPPPDFFDLEATLDARQAAETIAAKIDKWAKTGAFAGGALWA